jgi:hypothetical protein
MTGLPDADAVVAAMRRSGIIATSASVRVQRGQWALVVHADESNWIVREIQTPAPIAVLGLSLEIEGRFPDVGLAISPALQGMVWRLDRESELKDLLRHLAMPALVLSSREPVSEAADAMASVLSLFHPEGPSERALLRPPELIDGLGIPSPIVAAMHAPRLEVEPDRRGGDESGDASYPGGPFADGDWSLEFWSLNSTMGAGGVAARSVLHRWNVTSRAGEVAWWAYPEWTSR